MLCPVRAVEGKLSERAWGPGWCRYRCRCRALTDRQPLHQFHPSTTGRGRGRGRSFWLPSRNPFFFSFFIFNFENQNGTEQNRQDKPASNIIKLQTSNFRGWDCDPPAPHRRISTESKSRNSHSHSFEYLVSLSRSHRSLTLSFSPFPFLFFLFFAVSRPLSSAQLSSQ